MDEQIKELTQLIRAATFGWLHFTSTVVSWLTNCAPRADSQNACPFYIIGAGHHAGSVFLIMIIGKRNEVDIASSGWVTDCLLAYVHSRFIRQRGSLVAFIHTSFFQLTAKGRNQLDE